MEKPIKTILLVENRNQTIAKHSLFLERCGFKFIHVLTQKEALKEIEGKGQSIHLILMDIDLEKEFEGIDAAAEVQKNCSCPVLFFSSRSNFEVLQKIEKINSYGYFIKDSGEAVLLSSIRTALRLSETENRLNQRNLEADVVNKKLVSTLSQFNLAIESSGLGLWNFNIKTGELSVNEQFFQMLGYSLAENLPLSQEKLKKYYHPEDFQKAEELLKKYMNDDLPFYQLELRMLHKNGNWVNVLSYGKVVERDQNGAPVKVSIIHQDITEKKIAAGSLLRCELENSIIMNAYPDLLFNISKEGMILNYHAPKSAEFFSPSSQLLKKNIQELLPAKVSKKAMEAIEKAIRSREITVFEYELFIQGEKHFFENRLIAISNDEVLSFVHDISDIKQDVEAVLKAHFKQGAIGITIASPDKKWLKINQKACDILGYSKAELKQKSWEEITYPDDQQKDKEQFRQLLRGEIEVYELEKRLIRKDGQICFVQLGVSCLRNRDGSIRYFIISLNDITPLKETEEALRISEAKYKIIAEYTNDWEIFLDRNQELVYMNRECERISGYTFEEYMTGQKKIPVIFFYPDMTKSLNESNGSDAYSNHKNFKEYEQEIVHKNGLKKIISVLIQPVILEDSQFVGIRVSIRDITEKKKLEEKKLFKNNVHLKMQKFASLGALSSVISHEIKQPLHVMRLIMDTILMRTRKTSPLDEIGHKNLNDLSAISLEIDKINNIVNTMKYLIRTTENTRFTPLNISDILIRQKKAYQPLLLSYSIQLNVYLAPNLPKVFADKILIEQMICNLLNNAIDNLEPLPKTDKLINLSCYEQRQNLIIKVSDNGTGIPENHLERIFQPFFSTKKSKDSTGMGLYIVKNIVEILGGSIKASNNKESGATFKISLPGGFL